jgi:tetratricopeptide (TPR) repeat protein
MTRRTRPAFGLCAPFFLLLSIATLPLAAQSGFEALATKANEAREADRLDEAAALYRKALELRPDWTDGWWHLGTSLYDRDDYAGAADAFQKAVELRPNAGLALAMLGLCEAKLGRAEALDHLERSRRLRAGGDPQVRRVALFTEGTLRLEAGEFSKAQELLDAVAREGAAQEELIVALGQSVLGIKPAAFASADPATRKIVRQAGWAEHYAALADFPAALHEYRSLAAEAPKFSNVQFACGRFLLANHRDSEAVEAFQREIENTPNHLLARLGIAGICMATDPAGGLPYAEQAVQLAPRLAEAHFLLGAIRLGLDRTEGAIAELETAQRLDPGEARIYFQLSRAYARAGRNEDAARANAAFLRLQEQAAAGRDDAAKP